nr:Rab geranylgeranyltransferase beta subunit [Hymenolepis microstoma]
MAHPIMDVNLSERYPQDVMFEKHIAFLKTMENKDDPTLDYLKLSGIYWSLTALDLMKRLDLYDKDGIVDLIKSCFNPDGGFAPAPNHDSHILYTLSAIQILVTYDEVNQIDSEKVIKYISSLQNSDGSFNGDKWGEVDSRFSFCAIASLSLLGVIPTSTLDISQPIEGVDIQMAVNFLVACQNPDGGFATRPGSESHAGQAYCVIGALSLLGQLRRLDIGKAAWWLAERQLPSGGLNGRPGKMPDVCYSWWVLASLTILGRLMWIDASELAKFICASQDTDTGGISDRPGNYPDPFHTLFGLAGLSLLSRLHVNSDQAMVNDDNEEVKDSPERSEVLESAFKNLNEINPVFCMPQYVIDRLSLRVQLL